MKCFECGEAGHFHDDCPKRKDTDGSIKTVHKAKTAAEENSSDSDTDNIEVFTASVNSVGPQQMGKWLVDSGASSHMTREKALLSEYQKFKISEKVGLGDGWTVDAIGVGNVCVKMKLKVGEPKKCVIYRVLYVPKFSL